MNSRPRHLEYPGAVALAVLAFTGGARAADAPLTPQPPETVQWHAAVAPTATLRAGQRSSIELTGQILDGWHVYGLKQHPDGPTELKFKVDDDQIVHPTGPPSGSHAIRRMDRGFGFEIEYYTNSLKLSLPIEVKQQVSAGKQQVPVSVRFQSCSERICLPPETTHLLVDIDVQPRA